LRKILAMMTSTAFTIIVAILALVIGFLMGMDFGKELDLRYCQRVMDEYLFKPKKLIEIHYPYYEREEDIPRGSKDL